MAEVERRRLQHDASSLVRITRNTHELAGLVTLKLVGLSVLQLRQFDPLEGDLIELAKVRAQADLNILLSGLAIHRLHPQVWPTFVTLKRSLDHDATDGHDRAQWSAKFANQ